MLGFRISLEIDFEEVGFDGFSVCGGTGAVGWEVEFGLCPFLLELFVLFEAGSLSVAILRRRASCCSVVSFLGGILG